MTEHRTRLNKLEKVVSPVTGHLMVMFKDWEPGEEPPPEKITVHVSYTDGSRKMPEEMTLAEYRRRFPDWESDEHIIVSYDDKEKE